MLQYIHIKNPTLLFQVLIDNNRKNFYTNKEKKRKEKKMKGSITV